MVALANALRTAPPARRQAVPVTTGRGKTTCVAVLPFVNLTGGAENDYFADGITEDVIAHLAKIHALSVISRTSVMVFKRRDRSLEEIGKTLGAKILLDGSVRRAGDRVRIVAKLIEVETDRHLWAETYDRQLTDIFSIQTKVWGQGKELTPEDFTTIKAKLVELRDCHDKLKDLLDIMHVQHKDDSAEYAAIVPKWLQVKMWILDASDLLENQKPPEYGGLNIPMFVTSEKIRKAQNELKDINTTKDEVIQRKPHLSKEALKRAVIFSYNRWRAAQLKFRTLPPKA